MVAMRNGRLAADRKGIKRDPSSEGSVSLQVPMGTCVGSKRDGQLKIITSPCPAVSAPVHSGLLAFLQSPTVTTAHIEVSDVMHEEWKLDSCSQLLAVYAISNNSNMPKQHSRCPRRVVFPQGDSQAASAAKCIKLCSKFRNGACRKDGAELLERYASFQMIFPDCCRVHFPSQPGHLLVLQLPSAAMTLIGAVQTLWHYGTLSSSVQISSPDSFLGGRDVKDTGQDDDDGTEREPGKSRGHGRGVACEEGPAKQRQPCTRCAVEATQRAAVKQDSCNSCGKQDLAEVLGSSRLQ